MRLLMTLCCCNYELASLQALAHEFLADKQSDSLMKEALENMKVFNARRKFRVSGAWRGGVW